MSITLNSLHWIYLIFIFLIIGIMVKKRDTTLVCIMGIFILGIVATKSLPLAISGVFNSLIYAITELLGTILIISIIYGMSKVLEATGISEVMISPFTKFIKTPTLAYWIIGILMMIISWFFWPSPAVALMGAVLLPVAVKVGLPAIGVAVAMNLFGHGIALSSDFIIQGAPKLTSEAAGLPVGDVINASIPLVITMGLVTTIVAFIILKRDMKNNKISAEENNINMSLYSNEKGTEGGIVKTMLSSRAKKIFSIIIPILFALDVFIMIKANLQGGDATALVGGTAIFILTLISMCTYKSKGLEEITQFLIKGFQFGFKIFGPVIPIAAFFYMGDMGFVTVFGEVLPKMSQGIVNDLGVALAHSVPLNDMVGAITLTSVGSITGLDGSGFSGISLVGPIARLFSTAIGSGAATLTALGQVAAIWVGGGTIVPWAVIPAAAICGVNPFELARRNLIPVIIGLVVTTVVAMFII
ncbi:hypothetical protein [Senegalia massiliensis]|uniref:hypothetical protein n=1 Tax=Senegalia massiliensis TaxID=1720316 RepID=UPI0010319D34|nr:hypothetical protein [Senegalia massiliensis]